MNFYGKTVRINKKGFKNPFVRGADITWIPSLKCHLKCDYCPYTIEGGTAKYEECSAEEWRQFFDKFIQGAETISQVHVSGGEPSIFKGMADVVNWLVSKNIHCVIYSTLLNPKELLRLNDHKYLLRIKAVYHKTDNKERFFNAYQQVKENVKDTRIFEVELPQMFDSELLHFFTPEEIRNFKTLHFAPDSPRTNRIFIGCSDIYRG